MAAVTKAGIWRTCGGSIRKAPLARFITPQQVAGLIAYLLSDAAAPLTGSAIPFDYGITAGY
ncbi:MAG: SDR family oxidoreductase [Gammaproteobacteria bacterium]